MSIPYALSPIFSDREIARAPVDGLMSNAPYCRDSNTPDLYLKLSRQLYLQIDPEIGLLSTLLDIFEPFRGREKYCLFVKAQSDVNQIVSPLYSDPLMQKFFHALPDRERTKNSPLDNMNCKKIEVRKVQPKSPLPNGLIKRVGWFYAHEALEYALAQWSITANPSKLGDHAGTRHFSIPPKATERWRILNNVLDETAFSEVDEERLGAAARCALKQFLRIMNDVFNHVPPEPIA